MGDFRAAWWRQTQGAFSIVLAKPDKRTTGYQRQEQKKRTLVFAATMRLKSLPLDEACPRMQNLIYANDYNSTMTDDFGEILQYCDCTYYEMQGSI